MTKVIYNNRRPVFDVTVSSALGDDIALATTLRDEEGNDVTAGTPTEFTLEIREAPGYGENFLDMDVVATVPQGDMDFSALPDVFVTINVHNNLHWANQKKGVYYAKMQGKMDNRMVAPLEFKIRITD